MPTLTSPASTARPEAADLGPLAWVLDELHKSLNSATQALRRFVRDAELSRGSDLAALDASPLRIARQQLHQAVGALEMVGLPVPARMLRAMEALTQKFVQRPEFCSEAAALKVERAGFALNDYLSGLIKGRRVSSVALFAQYRDVLDLLGEDRIHPADLWDQPRQVRAVPDLPAAPPMPYDAPAVRSRFDGLILNVVKTGNAPSARVLGDVCRAFYWEQKEPLVQSYWAVAAAYFEAMSLGLLAPDVYAKRAASRVLLQYRQLLKGDAQVSEQLARDLLFFCAQALPPEAPGSAPSLRAVRAAWGLDQTQPVDYAQPRFGHYDPTLLAQARKRMAAAAEIWSALSGGDASRLRAAQEQFSLVVDSIERLQPEAHALAQALSRVIDSLGHGNGLPSPALAMEVATAVLYLEAAYDDPDPTDAQRLQRGERLAQRLDQVLAGEPSPPLDGWMEELYRRVSDRQTMGSVVDELRASLGEVETALDAYFRQPAEKRPVLEVPGKLAQMRGVFTVLGLDQAALAVLRMRDRVERCLVDGPDAPANSPQAFEALGSSLGALGFLIDMLSYQRELAKKLFVFDEAQGVLRSVMGRQKEEGKSPSAHTDTAQEATNTVAIEAVQTRSTPVPESASAAPVPSPAAAPEDDGELRDIFLEDAAEVVANGQQALAQLRAAPADLALQTSLRRAYHTLKGSARMVGLTEFGEAAWAMEQLLNAWLPQQLPAPAALLDLSDQAMAGFGAWVQAIAQGQDGPWRAQPFRDSADALRLHQQVLALVLPGAAPAQAAASAAQTPQAPEPVQAPDFAHTQFVEEPTAAPAREGWLLEPAAPESPDLLDELDLDFSTVQEASEPALDAAPEGPAQPDVAAALTVHPDAPAPAPAAQFEPEPEMRQIGDLKVDAGLYAIYLSEADDWSSDLVQALQRGLATPPRNPDDACVALAHSLAGSSATVGYTGLSGLARALEHALQRVQAQGGTSPSQAQVLLDAAEHLRSLLHQFAAGFLKEPEPQILEALHGVAPSANPAVLNPVASPANLELDVGAQAVSDLPADDGAMDAAVQPAPAEPSLPSEKPDRLDVDLFAIFEEEAHDLLPQLGSALRQWQAQPLDASARTQALRVLHTLKGSARLAGALRLGDQAHSLETAVEAVTPDAAAAPGVAPLLAQYDALVQAFEALCAGAVQALAPQPTLAQAGSGTPDSAPPESGTTPVQWQDAARVALPVAVDGAHNPLQRQRGGQSLRVKADLLDRLVNQAGEVLTTRSRLAARLGGLRGAIDELDANLARLQTQLRELETQAESQMQSRLAQARDAAQDFDPLEMDRFTRVQELTRMMAESVHDVATVRTSLQRNLEGVEDDLTAQARQARELQHDLLRTRMTEFDSLADRLYGVVRQAAKDAGRSVRLDIEGGTLELDRGVLERVAPVFEHLLRNAVGHGIEPPEQRLAAGKPELGQVRVALVQQGNEVVATVSDDGRGLNLEAIRTRAVALGLLRADEQPGAHALAQLIFASGLSTASEVSALSGRGIGMDVVRAEINALGGRVELSTQPGQGTQFRLVLPLTTAVSHVVLVRVGQQVVGVPAGLVEQVRRISGAELDAAYASGRFAQGGGTLAFFWAGAVLQASRASTEPRGTHAVVLVVHSAGQRLALHVDEVLGNQELVVKNLGPQLATLPGLMGMSVLASGAVVLIYNPVALVLHYGDAIQDLMAGVAQASSAPALAVPAVGAAALAPLVLVVDDSVTVRRVTQRLLQREGYRVALANDGLHALEVLAQERPVVVLSDIEMPRMDGFDLVRNLRAHAQWADLPVIMITSRLADKHRALAASLGVQHYLGKPFDEAELLRWVQHYSALAATATATDAAAGA
ncbi:MAG: hypothetical protein Fur007_00090 [Rhodoferax sp.]